MKIGIDANPLTTPFPCGTKNYVLNLLKNLASIDKKNEYLIFAKKKVSIPKQNNFKLLILPSWIPFFRRQLFIPLFVIKEKVDIFHNTEPYGSIFLNHRKTITTVHDINLSLTYPFFSKYLLNRIYCELSRYWVFKKTCLFITVSETVKDELIKKIGRSKVLKNITIFNGHDQKMFFEKTNFKKNILCMGDFSYRKNIRRLLKVYKLLPERIRKQHNLVIISSTNSSSTTFKKISNILKISKNIKIFTAINNNMLTKLYKNSYIFIYPSLYEGFGIPILEAMACGCPVITSNYGAMEEISGNSALLVDPKSDESITNGILRIFKDRRLRQSLIKKGLKRAKDFNWLKTAKKTLKVYENLYEQNFKK